MKYLFLGFLMVLITSASYAQHANVMISDRLYPNEPSIFINPANTLEIVAGTNMNNQYFSSDGGLSWTIQTLNSNAYSVAGDPCIIADTAGNFYYFHLSNPATGSWLDRIVCQKSVDGGRLWNDGTGIGLNGSKDQDKEWAVVDPYNNNIYITWTQFDAYGSTNPDCQTNIMFSKSLDAGESFSESKVINTIPGNCIDEDNTVEGAVPAVGPNGEIYVAWSGHEKIYFTSSTDQGETWLEETVIADQNGGWDFAVPGIYRCNGMPITVCDLSNGPYHGRIYVNWSDQRNGPEDTDIWLKYSDDGGLSWSEDIRVNDDGSGKQQFFTWMAIDQTNGNLYFVFYDRRNYEDENTDVYMALSRDGGNQIMNFKVSELPFLPTDNIFFGDYTNISAHDNIVRPIWVRLQDGHRSIYTAIVNTDIITGVEEEHYVPLSMEQNYPNPFSSSTTFSFKINPPQIVSLSVLDMYGRERLRIIDDQLLESRKHIISFQPEDYSLPPGVYYFRLSVDGYSIQQKMIFVQ